MTDFNLGLLDDDAYKVEVLRTKLLGVPLRKGYFPIENLDLSNYVSGDMSDRAPIYDLFGVSQHSGNMNGGHYTAICKNFDDQHWYKFNDSHVSLARETDIVTAEAYVLFYRRRHSVVVTGIASLSPTCQSSADVDEDDMTDIDNDVISNNACDFLARSHKDSFVRQGLSSPSPLDQSGESGRRSYWDRND